MSELSKDFTSKQFFQKNELFCSLSVADPTFICIGKFHSTNRVRVKIKKIFNTFITSEATKSNNVQETYGSDYVDLH